jgi:hypothetical protein
LIEKIYYLRLKYRTMLTKSLELKKLVVLINLLIVNVIFTNLFFARDNFCNSYIYLFILL